MITAGKGFEMGIADLTKSFSFSQMDELTPVPKKWGEHIAKQYLYDLSWNLVAIILSSLLHEFIISLIIF